MAITIGDLVLAPTNLPAKSVGWWDNWLFASDLGGKVVHRIEGTSATRYVSRGREYIRFHGDGLLLYENEESENLVESVELKKGDYEILGLAKDVVSKEPEIASWRGMNESDKWQFLDWATGALSARWEKGRETYQSDITGFQGFPSEHLEEELLDSLIYHWVLVRQVKAMREVIERLEASVQELQAKQ